MKIISFTTWAQGQLAPAAGGTSSQCRKPPRGKKAGSTRLLGTEARPCARIKGVTASLLKLGASKTT